MVDFEKWNIKHQNQTERDVAEITKLFELVITQVALYMANISITDKIFKFNNHPVLKKRLHKLFRQHAFNVERNIETSVAKHWGFSNKKTNQFVKKAYNFYGNKKEVLNTRNAEGLASFRKRKGRKLSSRIWKQTGQFKQEIEMAIDTAIKNGTPANQLATELKKYLKEPDKLFRKYRDNNGQLQLSKNAKAYKTGQGVYKSSFKNAQRLARTEINMAYRLADIDRWQNLDFIIGYEIKRSKHPYPCVICEMMVGVYPKNFVWSGNHPNCRCYLVPIFKSKKEYEEDLKNYIKTGKRSNSKQITKVNPKFTKWVNENQDKIQRAKSLPYFLRDNPKYVTKAVKNRVNSERIIDKLNTYKSKVFVKAKKVFSGLLSDATGGLAYLGIGGINKAIELYNKKKVNAEKVAILKDIAKMKDFKAIKNLSTKDNTIYGFNVKQYEKILKEKEMPKNIVIAKKLLSNNYDVYLLPNPSKIKSADFIAVKGRKYYYYEAKTINGKSTLKTRLQEASTQSDRIILDVLGVNKPKEIAENIKWFFNSFDSPVEVILFKRGRIISVTRQIVEKKGFEKSFVINWVGKGKKNKRF